jgi:hypothetical protein
MSKQKTAKRKLLTKAQRSAKMRVARANQLKTMNTRAYILAAKSPKTLKIWRKKNAERKAA